MRLLVVILNWRTPDLTLRAAEAALRETAFCGAHLTVVDNDSGDGSFERLSGALAAEPRAQVIQSGRNGGYGAGNNAGIRAGMHDGGPFERVLILNSDAFLDEDAALALSRHLDAYPRAGLAGSHIHGEDGETHLTTFRFPSVASELEGAARFGPISRLLRGREVPVPTPDASGPVDWLAGASMMVRAEVLDRVGLFDEGFFLYYEETDLCRRAAQAGWETHFVRDSRVTHVGSASTGMSDWERVPGYWFDSRWRYFVKHHGTAAALAATGAQVAGGLVHRVRRGLSGRRAFDPRRYLLDLVAHDLAASRRPLTPAPLAPRPDPAPAE